MSALGRLSVIDPAGKRQEIPLEKVPFTMGRLGDNDLLLRDNRVSRNHAQIIREDGRIFLIDLDSRHGTFVNGQKVVGKHPLAANDRIEFGVTDSYVVVFSTETPTVSKLLDRFKGPADSGTVRELQNLSAMLEVSRVLHAGLSLHDILTAVVDSSLVVARAERGFLMLKGEDGKMEFTVARDRAKTTLGREDVKLSQSVIERALQTRRPVIHTDVGGSGEEDLMAQRSVADLELQTLICLPLLKVQVTEAVETTVYSTQGEVVGVLYMDSRQPTSAFSDTSREILQSLCMEAASVIENAKLLSASKEAEKVQRDLEIAREIQQQLLPKKVEAGDQFHVSGLNVACQEVGGDYFDIFSLGGGRYGVVIADVSGKGMSAALLASMLQGVFWGTAVSGVSPAEVARRVNGYVCERSTSDKYATLFYGILEPDGRLVYVNAGHNPPMLIATDNTIQPLAAENLPIGMFPLAEYCESTVAFDSGATLVLYTDGVTEANNAADEMFGEDRLKEHLALASGSSPVEQIRDRLLQAVRSFVANEPQSDDITVVVARRN